MLIYLNKASEGWIVDRLRNEWYENCVDVSGRFLFSSDIVWIISPWTFNELFFKFIGNKKIVYSIYHFEENDLNKIKSKIEKIDDYISCYHTISKKTKSILEKLTSKEVYYIPFWIDSKIWFEIKNKEDLFQKFNLNFKNYYVGSFQRDSLRSNPAKPKLIKGPDIFVENMIELREKKQNLEILLAGKKRDYIINRLEKEKIPYRYFEMVNQKELNELYNCLNLYVISSRVEGGPQAIAECGMTMTPLVSTDVGMASDFLNKKSIYKKGEFLKAVPDPKYLNKKITNLVIPDGLELFKNMFKNLK